MAVSWTRHRFSGGVLALDVANTVVHRCDPVRRFDRFDDPAELPRFAAAASGFREAELGGRRLQIADAARIRPVVLEIREAVDTLFRPSAAEGGLRAALLPALLAACGRGLDGQPGLAFLRGPAHAAAEPLDFEAALSVSALSLLDPARAQRLRICPNCGWLFADRSRNASRLWCDMAVCGNRAKARRHYQRTSGAAR